ncbi:MAG: tyrosine-type recombinase/integrase [Proteobacteria bacterium]|nr:tyrosine-type recombinase/integrase [Pseudomonadota bacterium]
MNKLNSMKAAVGRYLDERRSLGFELIEQGKNLLRFARYADERNHCGPLTQELVLGWACEHVRRTSEVTAAGRLMKIRPFTSYYRQFQPDSYIPEPGVLGRERRRPVPHIYTDQEIVELLEATKRLEPRNGLRPFTYRTLFGLIAAAGLRLSEALNLTVSDVDLDAGTITIRETKFKKSRCLPLHPSTVDALALYRQSRECYFHSGKSAAFFMADDGFCLSASAVSHAFHQLRTFMGWQSRGDHPIPRIHDLRHTFAVRRLQRWREEGQLIDQGVYWLCTYLGHGKISSTYWYLSGVPELMDLISARFESFVTTGELT